MFHLKMQVFKGLNYVHLAGCSSLIYYGPYDWLDKHFKNDTYKGTLSLSRVGFIM